MNLYYDRFPSKLKDPAENIRWRIALRHAALVDKILQRDLRQAAFQDVLFFVNAFAFMQEPRAVVKVRPFTSWPHQDAVIRRMDEGLDEAERTERPVDIAVDKSRGQGATWICLWILIRRWLRDADFLAGLVTRNERLVDSTTNKDALLYKVDWAIKMLPRWMQPRSWTHGYKDHTISNGDIGGVMTGFPCTADVGRGGRQTAFLLDEFGAFPDGADWRALDSTQHVTNYRLIVSTYCGDTNAYHAVVTEKTAKSRVEVLDWKDNPGQNDLMYYWKDHLPYLVKQDRAEKARLNAYLDQHALELDRQRRRGFTPDGIVTSPWRDDKCSQQGATPHGIAQEIDRNPRGTVGKVVSVEVLTRMEKECVKNPLWQGVIDVSEDKAKLSKLIERPGGVFKLWFKPGIDLEAPAGKFALGCDIAAGTGTTSNSAIVGIDMTSGEQVLEYADTRIKPEKFARLAVALCRWLGNAFLAWEGTGPTGSAFRNEVMDELFYGNVYYAPEEKEQVVGSRGKTVGWVNNSSSAKGTLFSQVEDAMDRGQFVPRSADLVREFGEYEWDGGKAVHKPTKVRGEDEKSHGDRAVAGGVCWLAVRSREGFSIDTDAKMANTTVEAPWGSMQWRHNEARRRQEAEHGRSVFCFNK